MNPKSDVIHSVKGQAGQAASTFLRPELLAPAALMLAVVTALSGCSTGGGISVMLASGSEPGFTLTVNPPAGDATEGDSVVVFTTTLQSKNGWSGDVALDVSGYPTGSYGYIPNNPVFLPADGTVEVQDWVKPGCLAAQHSGGSYRLTFTATGTGLTPNQVTATLVVSDNPGC